MSGIVIIIIALVIIIVAVAAVVMLSGKKSGQKEGKEQKGIKDLQVDAVEMKRKKEPVREAPEVTAAKKELYQYLTQVIKRMFMHYRRGSWDKLTRINVPSDEVQKYYDKIRQSLTSQSVSILDDFFACIDMEGGEESRPEEEQSQPGKKDSQPENEESRPEGEQSQPENKGNQPESEQSQPENKESQPESKRDRTGAVRDPEGLRKVFQRMVLPFYPVYYDKLDGIRYTSLLNQTMLNMFHRLTGKKFRLGYKNRYRSGVTAYRWEGNRYQVYMEDGTKLCDAVFQDGKVWDGYACIPVEEQKDGDWEMIQAGTFRDGVFVDGALQYIYRKKCGQL